MAVRIYSEEDLPLKRWSELTGNSFINSLPFLSLWKKSGGNPIFVIDADDDRIIAGLSGVIFGAGLIRRFESSPRNLPGGIFFAENLSEEDKIESGQKILKELNKTGLIRSVITPVTDNVDCYDGYEKKSMEVHLVDLERGEESFSKSTRHHLKSGLRRGGEVEAVNSEEDIDSVMKLYREICERHGAKRTDSKGFFLKMYEISQKDPRLVFLKAKLDDKIIGARVSIFEREMVINWHNYIDYDYRKFKPTHIMMQHIIDMAGKKGIKYINMGASPEGSESLRNYKESWGGKSVEWNYYVRYSGIGRLLKIWRKV